MGVFDGELYALGYRFEDDEDLKPKPVEAVPSVGARVSVYGPHGPGRVNGTVMYLSDENVIIRFDTQYGGGFDGLTKKYEKQYNPRVQSFYELITEEIKE